MALDRRLHLPGDMHFAQDAYQSSQDMSHLEFALLTALTFVIYGMCAYALYRQEESSNSALVFCLIGFCTVLCGCIYIFTPAALSGDIYSYASYGRLLSIHHANPYVVPPSAYAQDPTYHLLYWRHVVTIYGPVWTIISAALVLLSGTSNMGFLISFRMLAFASHLLNMLLVASILHTMSRPRRIIAFGTLLYAWNPLVLLESGLGGHNDVLMLTFMLLGILLYVRMECSGQDRFYAYIPPLVAFTLAALVKFIAAPLVVVFIVMLFWKRGSEWGWRAWRSALLTAMLASAISAAVALLFYGLFWIGHSINDIVSSFTSQPTAHSTFDSILFILNILKHTRVLPSYLALFADHAVWNVLILAAMLCTLASGVLLLKRSPGIRTVILAALLCLGMFALLAPWFDPWYVVWLLGLAVVCLPVTGDRLGRALLVMALSFSISAFLPYSYANVVNWLFNASRIGWFFLAYSGTFGIPLIAFSLALLPALPLSRLSAITARFARNLLPAWKSTMREGRVEHTQ